MLFFLVKSSSSKENGFFLEHISKLKNLSKSEIKIIHSRQVLYYTLKDQFGAHSTLIHIASWDMNVMNGKNTSQRKNIDHKWIQLIYKERKTKRYLRRVVEYWWIIFEYSKQKERSVCTANDRVKLGSFAIPVETLHFCHAWLMGLSIVEVELCFD